ncbi:transporter, major facilitator family protein [Bifidobacterium gallicum DSM 20093 = LMG 11596]|uniref:Transporter, major facilitator family protein n=2 Tax=Bifidobacterium gallicum TaxID=78342 RepID=D1NUJ1_9BIFI|nr:transporter, major facilitator family protein [Bifidobacterium gallicum DSM 20093 = LMG 11596]
MTIFKNPLPHFPNSRPLVSNSFVSGIKDVGNRLFGGYAKLLRMPHTARFTFGAVIACMPYPMVGMTITICVQFYYHNYTLAGSLTAVQAIAGAILSPVLGILVDRFGQRRVSIPLVIIWLIAAMSIITCIKAHVAPWILFCIVPFLACVPPWGAMSRARWTNLLKHDREGINRAMSLCSVADEAMWVIGNPLASILAVISGLLAFSFTGVCVIIGALMFLTCVSTEPASQTELARAEGMTRKTFREHENEKAEQLKADTARQDAEAQARAQGLDEAAVTAAGEQAWQQSREQSHSGRKESIFGPGLLAVCVTWFGLGAFQSAAGISIIAFATESGQKQLTGFVFACFSISSLTGALIYGAKNWQIALYKRFYFCLAVVNLGIGTFLFAKHLWVIMIIYLIIGVCQAPTWINGNQIMLHLVPQSRLTEGMAWMGAMNSIGGSAGSAVAGMFIDRNGSQGGFAVVTTLALASLAVALIGFRQIKISTQTPVLTEIALDEPEREELREVAAIDPAVQANNPDTSFDPRHVEQR